MTQQGATFLFESNRQSFYSERGIRKMFTRYSQDAQLETSISPHKLRYFLFWILDKPDGDN